MNKKLPLVVVILATFTVAGCETGGGTASRIQEKSAVYNNLAPWQQRDIQDGVVSIGSSTDMVYMALGKPSKIVTSANGRETTWTYNNYYPPSARSQARATLNTAGGPGNPTRVENSNSPRGAAKTDTSTRGSTQTNLDVADLPSDTLYVMFRDGQVFQTQLESEK
jgi:hypothetical protein